MEDGIILCDIVKPIHPQHMQVRIEIDAAPKPRFDKFFWSLIL